MFGQEEKEAVLRVLDKGILSGFQGNWSDAFYGGPEIKALEEEWSNYFNVKHSVTCNSATSGLWLACSAIGLKPGDECIVSPYSMTCSASIPLHFGAKSVFIDIEKDYFCIDPKKIEEKITDKTKAIIVVDLFGLPADYDAINAIAKKHGLYVIEDAAQAIGAKYKGKYAGTLGDIGVFSLNRHKHINCGEGGVVVTDNSEIDFRIRLLMNHSEAVVNDMELKDEFVFTERSNLQLVGMNMRMTELQAAIAREQLKKLPGILEKVREHAKYFPVKVRPECEHSYYRYVHDGNAIIDGTIFNTKKHYITPLFKLPLFKNLGYDQEQCPVCQEIERKIYLSWLKGVC